jgi:hypothetical protein
MSKIQGNNRGNNQPTQGHNPNTTPKHVQTDAHRNASTLANGSMAKVPANHAHSPVSSTIRETQIKLDRVNDQLHRASTHQSFTYADGFKSSRDPKTRTNTYKEPPQHLVQQKQELEARLQSLQDHEKRFGTSHPPEHLSKPTQLGHRQEMLKIHQPPKNSILSGKKSLPLKSKQMFNIHPPKGGKARLIVAASLAAAAVGTIAFNLFNKKINLTADSKN